MAPAAPVLGPNSCWYCDTVSYAFFSIMQEASYFYDLIRSITFTYQATECVVVSSPLVISPPSTLESHMEPEEMLYRRHHYLSLVIQNVK